MGGIAGIGEAAGIGTPGYITGGAPGAGIGGIGAPMGGGTPQGAIGGGI